MEFFWSVLKCDKHLCLALLARYEWDVHNVRRTVHDVMMMYCKERYMKNLPMYTTNWSEWLHVKYLLTIFTADCLCHPIQMANIILSRWQVWKSYGSWTLLVPSSADCGASYFPMQSLLCSLKLD